MVWRNMANGKDRSKKDDKKNSLKTYVDQGLPIGILCYDNTEPTAWCAVAPRDSYRNLGGTKTRDPVWSLVCFFVKKDHRKQGVIRKLIATAEQYAKKNGAAYLEAYPVDKASPSYRFMGFKSTFEASGYHFKQKAGTRRNVMIKKLK